MNGMESIQQVFIVGIVATAVLDVWQRLVQVTVGVPATNWALVGRWISHMPRGKFIHPAIADLRSVPYEAVTGWVAHYVIGFVYAAAYLLLVRGIFDTEPTPVTAIGFGAITVAAPWLLLQPGMGLGVFARNASNPKLVRLQNLVSHIVFGIGLYLAIALVG